MRKLFTVVAVFCVSILVLTQTQSASAHTLKVDGQTGVTLHIDPDDEPVAQKPAKLLIGVQDKKGAFAANVATCVCKVTIRSGDVTITQMDFSPRSDGNTSLEYTFNTPGIYKVDIDGKPADGGGNTFAAFGVSFSYRVKAGASSDSADLNSSTEQNPLQTYTPFVVIAALLFSVVLFFMPTRSKKSPKVS